MTKRTRGNHAPAFKAKVALAALKGEKTLAELAQIYNVQTNPATSVGFGNVTEPSTALGGVLPVVPGYFGFDITAHLMQCAMLLVYWLVLSLYMRLLARILSLIRNFINCLYFFGKSSSHMKLNLKAAIDHLIPPSAHHHVNQKISKMLVIKTQPFTKIFCADSPFMLHVEHSLHSN